MFGRKLPSTLRTAAVGCAPSAGGSAVWPTIAVISGSRGSRARGRGWAVVPGAGAIASSRARESGEKICRASADTGRRGAPPSIDSQHAVQRWDDEPVEELTPLIGRQVVHTETMTVARIHLRAGAGVPTHAPHPRAGRDRDRGQTAVRRRRRGDVVSARRERVRSERGASRGRGARATRSCSTSSRLCETTGYEATTRT